MHSANMFLDAGLLIGLAGIALAVRQVRRRLRESVSARLARKVEEIADIGCVTVIFGAMVVMQFGSIALHISDQTPPSVPWFTLLSSLSIVLLFGFSLGRLVMRWQVRRLLTPPAIENGELTSRA